MVRDDLIETIAHVLTFVLAVLAGRSFYTDVIKKESTPLMLLSIFVAYIILALLKNILLGILLGPRRGGRYPDQPQPSKPQPKNRKKKK